jgi:hypothetical protein
MKVKCGTMLPTLMKGQRDVMMKTLMKVEFMRKMNHSHAM